MLFSCVSLNNLVIISYKDKQNNIHDIGMQLSSTVTERLRQKCSN
jgi:hypothetical protein